MKLCSFFKKTLLCCLLAGVVSHASPCTYTHAQDNPQQPAIENSTENVGVRPPYTIITAPQPSTQLFPQAPWRTLEQGLDAATFTLKAHNNTQLEILRFDPRHFTFVLHSTTQDDSAPKTLDQWARTEDVVAAINASMYLPDGRTSTGYMRSGTHINNKRISKAFGVFFLAQPTKEGLPFAQLIEKDDPDYNKAIDNYTVVIQNFRLINAQRQVLWAAGGQKHSIAAVGEDGRGNILFLHCKQPIEAHALAQELLRLPLDIRTVMYVEGGAQAGMVLRQNNQNTFWGGSHPAEMLIGTVSVALPNILGVKRKMPLK